MIYNVVYFILLFAIVSTWTCKINNKCLCQICRIYKVHNIFLLGYFGTNSNRFILKNIIQLNRLYILYYQFVGSLQTLDISYNELHSLEQGLEIFTPMEQTIQIIELNDNVLHHLQPGLFHRCGRLKSLSLANNKLDLNNLEAINEPSGITHLDVSGNPLVSIPYRFLHQLGAIWYLTIRNSSIQTIDPNAFVNIKSSLKTLDIRENEITYVKREMFQPMEPSEFDGLTLEGNQIICDCGCKQFQDWLNEFNLAGMDKATCKSSNGTLYVIKDDDLSQFCENQVRIICSVKNTKSQNCTTV